MKLPMYNKDGKMFPNSNFKTDTYYKSLNLCDAKKLGNEVYINAIRQSNNSKSALMKKGYVYMKNIFIKHWSSFKKQYASLLTRPSVIDNVEKFINCENFEKGFHYFTCKNGCGVHIQGFTCKSRFCPKCGKKYRDQRSAKIAEKLIDAPHRQFVFSIPEEYRYYLKKYRSLINVLFDSVNYSFNKLLGNESGISKQEHRKLGFISFLHTYGRDMKWNPHLHVLVAERYINKDGEIKKFAYFHFEQLRKVYKYTLMNNLYKALRDIDDVDKKDLSMLFIINKNLNSKYDKGFYVHGPQLKNNSISSVKAIAKYITRYASHPAISERRILEVDENNHTVTWFYDPHEDDNIEIEENKLGRQKITEHVFEFMKRLIIHIPDKNFRQIRYYGFYSNSTKLKRSTSLFTKKQLKAMLNDTLWVRGLLQSFGYTPLLCSTCGERMHLSIKESFFPRKTGGEFT